MRFAMYVPNFDTFGNVSTVVELARAAEHAGWDGFFLHRAPTDDAEHSAAHGHGYVGVFVHSYGVYRRPVWDQPPPNV